MKHIKMLGLVTVAAAALMAFVGSSTASATVLCKTEGTSSPTGTTCPEGWAHGAGVEIHAVNLGTVTLDGEPFNVECAVSTIKGKTENEGNATETVRGKIETWTLNSCGPSTVTVLKTGVFEIHWIEGTHNGTLTVNGWEFTTTTSTIFGNIHCIFVVENQSVGDITGGNPAVFHSTAKIRRLPTNSLCPNEGAWTATYEFTTPKPLYIAGHT